MATRRDLTKVSIAAVAASMLIGSAAAQTSPPAESTLERVRRTKKLRVSILAGEAPFWVKDVAAGTWSGAGMAMAQDIAKALDATVTIVEGNMSSAIADVQTGKADLTFPFNATPQRALAVRFTAPIYVQSIVYVGRPELKAASWADLDNSNVKLATIIGGLSDVFAKRYSPKAQITAFKTRDDAILAAQSGRADAFIVAMMQGIGVQSRFPAMWKVAPLANPLITLPSSIVIPQDTDYAWRDFLNAWIESARGARQIHEWIVEGFAKSGVNREQLPANIEF